MFFLYSWAQNPSRVRHTERTDNKRNRDIQAKLTDTHIRQKGTKDRKTDRKDRQTDRKDRKVDRKDRDLKVRFCASLYTTIQQNG